MTESAGESSRLLPKNDDGCESLSIPAKGRRLLKGYKILPSFAVVLLVGLLGGAMVLRFKTADLNTDGADNADAGSTVSTSKGQTGEGRYVSSFLHGFRASQGKPTGQPQATGENRDGVDFSAEGGQGADAVPQASPPNVIFILLDDVGMNDLGYLSTDLKTVSPFIDTLANEGVKIERYYTNHICTPARASLMTGRDSFRTGMQYEEIQASHNWALPADEATLADRFKAAGYSTHMAGKWNLGNYAEQFYPFNRGFDTFLGYMGAQETYYTHSWGIYKDFGYGDKDGYLDEETNSTRMFDELYDMYSTTITGHRAIQVAQDHSRKLAEGRTEPLFLYLAFQAAHSPLDVPTDDLFTKEELLDLSSVQSTYKRRSQFAKIVFYVDVMLKKVFGEMDKLGMLENTLVVFASDNGACPANGGNNFPFRGVKHTQFEGGVRTPAFVYSKSTSIIPAEARGSTYKGMMHAMDWTQTLANVTGIPTAGMGQILSGFDHWQAILGQLPESAPPIRNELVLRRNSFRYDTEAASMVHALESTGAYIYDGWKIVMRDKCTGWFSFNPDDEVPTAECEVAKSPLGSDACSPDEYTNVSFMFHLDEDPYEQVNLVEAMPEKFAEMTQRWDDATVDEIPSNFRMSDTRAYEAWAKFNDFVIAWL